MKKPDGMGGRPGSPRLFHKMLFARPMNFSAIFHQAANPPLPFRGDWPIGLPDRGRKENSDANAAVPHDPD